MAAFTDAAQFSVFATHNDSGQVCANTYGLYAHDDTDPVTFGVLTDFLASGWMDDLVDQYLSLLADTFTLDLVVARRCFDPLNPTDPAPEASRTVDSAGLRATDESTALQLCALLRGHTDTASRRARSHKFMPPVDASTQINPDHRFAPAGTYMTQVTNLATVLESLLFTAGGGHAGGAASDFDLATYSLTARREDAPNYLFRWSSITTPLDVHFLRSRTPGP